MTRRRVAIIGGGIAGMSAAWALAPDHDVVVFETEAQLGQHATGRSAAILSETSGTRVVCALARASRPFLETAPDGFSPVPIAAPRGLLWIARAGDEELVRRIAAVAASGVAPTAHALSPTDARALAPALRPAAVAGGALFEPDARTLDVAALLEGYARGAIAAGATVRRDAELRAATPGPGGGWELETAVGRFTADVLVDAAGAWGDVVAERSGVIPLGLTPRRRTACVVRTPIEVRGWPLVMDAAGRCYFEPEAGGLLLSPADEHPSPPGDARPEEIDVAWALHVLDETTTLGVRSVRRAWAGLRTFAPDRVPAVGWDPRVADFLWVVGQGGAGIKTAPAIAAAVRALVADRPWPAEIADLGVTADDLAPSRFGPPAAPRSPGVDDQDDGRRQAEGQHGRSRPAPIDVGTQGAADRQAEHEPGQE
jgi:D-arginine dehydrogenase